MSNHKHELSLVTVDRHKSLTFIEKQVFWKFETQKDHVFLLELSWFKCSPDNHTYAQQVCKFIIERYLQLLGQWINQPSNRNHVNYSQYFNARHQISKQKQLYIDTKIKQFYRACDLHPCNQIHIYDPVESPPNKKRKICEISDSTYDEITIHNSLSVMINTIRRQQNIHIKNTLLNGIIAKLQNEITSVSAPVSTVSVSVPALEATESSNKENNSSNNRNQLLNMSIPDKIVIKSIKHKPTFDTNNKSKNVNNDLNKNEINILNDNLNETNETIMILNDNLNV
eukprot:512500_1